MLLCKEKRVFIHKFCINTRFWWAEVDSNHRSRRRQIYSLIHLAALESAHIIYFFKVGAGDWTRTHNLLITNQLLCQLSYTGLWCFWLCFYTIFDYHTQHSTLCVFRGGILWLRHKGNGRNQFSLIGVANYFCSLTRTTVNAVFSQRSTYHTQHSTLCVLCWVWCLGAESNHRQADFQSAALPTELPRHAWRPKTGSNRRPPAWQAGALTNWAIGPRMSLHSNNACI